MSAEINQFGLSRRIPEAIKREVRRRSGFGCVRCGFAVYEYEHVDPPFETATEHDPARITLLCKRCHGLVTGGLLSKDTVAKAMRSPKCLSEGHSRGPFDVGNTHPDIVAGPLRAVRTRHLVRVFGKPILSVDGPEEPGGPFRLSALLCDSTGRESLRMDNNEWIASAENWDIVVEGRRIIVRRGPGDIALRLRSDPPQTIAIERLDMYYRGAWLSCDEERGFRAQMPNGSFVQPGAATVEDCVSAVDVRSDGLVVGVGCRRITAASVAVGCREPITESGRQRIADLRAVQRELEGGLASSSRAALAEQDREDMFTSWNDLRAAVSSMVFDDPRSSGAQIRSLDFAPYAEAITVDMGYEETRQVFTVSALPKVAIPGPRGQAEAVAEAIIAEVQRRMVSKDSDSEE